MRVVYHFATAYKYVIEKCGEKTYDHQGSFL